MKIPPVKGTRDFYPAEMVCRNWIIGGWKSASVRNGFQEYDGPIIEHLRMFQIKSGEEIASQLYCLEDAAGRSLALRPEITPTLARMVNQRVNSLPRPIKWFSVPRLLRAERPQRGRLREFFQWNIDIIGVEDELADAEIIFCAVDYLRQVGLTADDIVVKISSRRMIGQILRSIGVAEGELDGLYAALDKRDKIPPEAFSRMLQKAVADEKVRLKVTELMEVGSLDEIGVLFGLSQEAKTAVGQVRRLFELLEIMELGDYCIFDMGTVRGLAYYTGIVFEIWDRAGDLRAVGGGGRYDNLFGLFGGPDLPATGFGMGDCVLEILLRNKKLLEKQLPQERLDFYVAPASAEFFDKAVELTMKLRSLGRAADFNYKFLKLGKQLKQASDRNAARCVIIGEEYSAGKELVVKDMATGKQRAVDFQRFLEEARRKAPGPQAEAL